MKKKKNTFELMNQMTIFSFFFEFVLLRRNIHFVSMLKEQKVSFTSVTFDSFMKGIHKNEMLLLFSFDFFFFLLCYGLTWK